MGHNAAKLCLNMYNQDCQMSCNIHLGHRCKFSAHNSQLCFISKCRWLQRTTLGGTSHVLTRARACNTTGRALPQQVRKG